MKRNRRSIKNQQTDLQNQRMSKELRDLLDPANKRIKIPESLSPGAITGMLRNLGAAGASIMPAVKVFTVRRMVSLAAAFAILVSSVTVSVIISKYSQNFSHTDESSAADTSYQSDQSSAAQDDGGISLPSSYIGPESGPGEGYAEELPEYQRRESIIYRIPSTAYYKDRNRMVLASKTNDYSTIISRLSYVREVIYQDYVYPSLADAPKSGMQQMQILSQSDEALKNSVGLYESGDGLYYYGGSRADGADRGGIVINDGQYIYTLSDRNKTLTIVDCRSQEMALLSQISFAQSDIASLTNIYVSGDTLVVIYVHSTGGTVSTAARFYDISDRSSPEIIRTFSQEGACASSVLAGGKLYMVTNREVGNMYDYMDEKYELYIPATTDSNVNNGMRTVLPADRIDIINTKNSTNYVVISSLDIADMAKAAYTYAILGNSGYIYQTDDNVYIVSLDYSSASLKTLLFKFDLGDEVLLYDTAFVNGCAVNQNAMDEYNGYFRIATVSPSLAQSSHIYVFNNALKKVGAAENLASGLSLQRVLFLDDTAYLTTNGNDGLVTAVDLSNPEAPAYLCSLKNGSYSSFMYKISHEYVIGIGYGRDQKGSRSGVKISLYDIADQDNPREIYHKTLGKAGSFSSVLNSEDGRSQFMYNSQTKLFSVPLTLTDDNNITEFSGVCIFKLDFDSSDLFKEVGRMTSWVQCQNNNSIYLGINEDLYSSRVTVMGDTIYLVSNNAVVSAYINDFSNSGSVLLGRKTTIVSSLINESTKAFITGERIVSPVIKGITYSPQKHRLYTY